MLAGSLHLVYAKTIILSFSVSVNSGNVYLDLKESKLLLIMSCMNVCDPRSLLALL